MTTVGGDVTGIVNTGNNALVVQVTTPRIGGRVLTHEQVVDALHGRRTYLRDEDLPFVRPGEDHEADPARLLARLSGPESRGVLIVGPAGAGKTRTLFETARIAHAEGRRVLHVQASPVVTVEDVAEQVLSSGADRILLVFDYLDACPQLDLSRLAEVRRSSAQVALIASARPGSVSALEQRGAGWLFDQVALRSDLTYRSAIADHIIRAVAPGAIRHWGEPALAAACGHRPIIALLIARAAEQRLAYDRPARRSRLPQAAELRPWLQDALRRDRLTGAESVARGPLEMLTPSTQELACAVAVSACPQARDAVEIAVEGFLATDGSSRYTGRQAVDALLWLGWLDEVGGELVPVHDTVTDELLIQSMLPRPGHSVHLPSAESLFEAASRQSRSFALFTDHLRRIMADLSTPARQHEAAALERFCRDWTVRNRDRLSDLLITAGKDGAQALLTMVLDQPWSAALQQCWSEIGRPWLKWAESTLQATAFLSAALRSQAAPAVLSTEALSWLSRRFGQTDADHVIRALLTRTDLPPTQSRMVLDHALDWVRQHPGWVAAPEILTKLLGRDARAERLEVAECALAWLTPRRSLGVSAVLRRLLEGHGWPAPVRDRIVDRAFARIRANPAETASILIPLLQSTEIVESQRQAAREMGLRWLQRNPSEPNRRSLIVALLSGTETDDPQDALWSLVDDLPIDAVDPIVMYQLLEDISIDAGRARRLVEKAFRRLDSADDPEARRLLLTALMSRDELTAAQHTRLLDEVASSLDDSPDPRYLTALLHRGSFLPARQLRRVVALTLERCRSDPSVKQRRPLMNALLLRRDLTGPEAAEIISVALIHLEKDLSPKAGGLLTSVLERDDLTPPDRDRALRKAASWMARQHDKPSNIRLYLLRDLLLRGDLPVPVAAACERFARDWLAVEVSDRSCAEQIRALLPYSGTS